jgi:hypothetical protein
MPKCEDQDFPCQIPDYSEFDSVAANELSNPVTANDIINFGTYCTFVPTDSDHVIGDMTHKLFLSGLGKKTGVYHLWVDYDECDDHATHTMLCVYVGKGPPKGRIPEHIKSKWPAGTMLYATFFECPNRLSKYYEQLFLDTYGFHLNSHENTGTKSLFAVWDEERHNFGTELHHVSSLSNVRSFDDI